MKKLFAWCKNNIIYLFSLVFMAFIPLYPKLPLVDVRHTWVYVRIEDFLVLFVLLLWGTLVARKKITLRSPLTIPILLFWIAGVIATIHGVLLIFPSIQEAYPNVAFLSMLRRMEYMSLFFVSYSAMKDKRYLSSFIIVLSGTVLAVALYGIGQKYLGFPAFLTMNEEFAKGIPIRLSQLSRVSSTFSGHYDLAAYLVLVLPILVSMVFGVRNLPVKGMLLASTLLGFIVLFMTVSRISVIALFLSLGLVLLMQRKKIVLVSFPIIAIITLFFVSISPGIVDRIGNTIKEIDVIVDAKTGVVIGHSQEVVKTYFAEKTVRQRFSRSIANLQAASPSAEFVVPYAQLEEKIVLLLEPSEPTGENLPQGTGYINLSLSPVARRFGYFMYEPKPKVATATAEVFVINGDYLLKKVLAYDLSFTTRFQGEWPRAMAAFKRNVLVGSGYGSVGLAVDNSYLRMLAEVGLLGFGSFLAIFLIAGMYIRKVLPDVDSVQVKSFIIGFIAGIAGLSVNAFFIDVFEASKVAFILWLLSGIVLGILRLYQRRPLDLYREFTRVVTSTPAIVVYLFILTILLYSPMTRNNFVGDDYTWLRWAANCGNDAAVSQRCQPSVWTVVRYFTQAEGFFYRPGAKLYFLFMYTIFWLNQNAYHAVSLMLHGVVTVLVFLLAKKTLKKLLPSVAAGVIFLLLSGYSEAVHWISATGILFTACFSLFSLHSYISWEEKKRPIYFVATLGFFILSLLFHELGIITPLLILLYKSIFSETMSIRQLLRDRYHKLLLLPIPVYLIVRYISHSHWLSGDYNYNLFRLPFNVVGNALGYLFLTLFGPISLPLYQLLRNGLKGHVAIALLVLAVAGLILAFVFKKYYRIVKKEDRKIILFGSGFFMLALVPFLGLGNMSSRYSYLSSIGIIFITIVALKHLYAFLLSSGRTIAVLSITIIVGVFSLLQIIQSQQIHGDWYEAGEKSRKFIVAMESVYDDSWAHKPMEFHFVNVPIRSGEAWIFPVGIPDALWLIFRNPNMRVFTWATKPEAFDAVSYDSSTQKVFEFDGSGKVTERIKPPNSP